MSATDILVARNRVVTMRYTGCAALLVAMVVPLGAIGDESCWGDLSGRFIYKGDPPAPKVIPVRKHASVFGATIPDESLVVHPDNHGVANVLVYVRPIKDQKARIHPSYEASSNAKIELAMQNGRFVPHILMLRTTQTMVHRSKDEVAYDPTMALFANPAM